MFYVSFLDEDEDEGDDGDIIFFLRIVNYDCHVHG